MVPVHWTGSRVSIVNDPGPDFRFRLRLQVYQEIKSKEESSSVRYFVLSIPLRNVLWYPKVSTFVSLHFPLYFYKTIVYLVSDSVESENVWHNGSRLEYSSIDVQGIDFLHQRSGVSQKHS